MKVKEFLETIELEGQQSIEFMFCDTNRKMYDLDEISGLEYVNLNEDLKYYVDTGAVYEEGNEYEMRYFKVLISQHDLYNFYNVKRVGISQDFVVIVVTR